MTDNEISAALADCGMPSGETEKFIEAYSLGKKSRAKEILTAHRAKLLSDLHTEQTKLYNTDFLLSKLKELKL